MPLAAPTGDLAGQTNANPFGLCRCTIPSKSPFLTPLLSAHEIIARICTFPSYLNSNPCNTYEPAPPNSSSFCTYSIRVAARISFSQKRACGPLPVSRHFSQALLSRSPLVTHHSSPSLPHFQQLTHSISSKPCIISRLRTPEEGVPQFPNHFLSAVCATTINKSPAFSIVQAIFGGAGRVCRMRLL